MPTQRADELQEVKYRVEEVDSSFLTTKRKSPEDKLNDLAERGWKVAETIDEDGGATQFIILEKSV